VRCSGLLGMVALSYAPTYGTNADGGRNFNVPLAVAGTALAAIWLLHRLAHLPGLRVRVVARELCAWRRSTMRYWQALTVCALTFTLLWLCRVPVRLAAIFAIATVVMGICLLANLGGLSLALLYRDRSRPLYALRWLTLPPASLVGIVVMLELDPGSSATLLIGCLGAYLGALLGGCPLWWPIRSLRRERQSQQQQQAGSTWSRSHGE
jgi:hypothetical protein